LGKATGQADFLVGRRRKVGGQVSEQSGILLPLLLRQSAEVRRTNPPGNPKGRRMKYFFDTEFIDDGKTIDLISIGVACDDGREYYAVSTDYNSGNASQWVWDHVLNHIPKDQRKKAPKVIARDLTEFIQGAPKLDPPGYAPPRLYGWYCAYDWVALCQLFGPMIGRPDHFPKLAYDLKPLCDLHGIGKISKSGFTRHNALEDARWNMHVYNEILRLPNHLDI